MKIDKFCVLAFAALLPLATIAKEEAEVLFVAEPVQTISSEEEEGNLLSDVVADTEEQNQVDKKSENNVQTTPPIDFFKKQALVVAKRSSVTRGEAYVADIIMLNPNPQCTYTTYVGGKQIVDGRIKIVCAGSVGDMSFSGYIEEKDRNGKKTQYPFSAEYQVIEPSASISNTGLNDVLYAGYANKLEVLAPGVPSSSLCLIVTNASLVKKANCFEVFPTFPSKDCDVKAIKKEGNKIQVLARKRFRVLPLPDPSAFLKFGEQTASGGKLTEENLAKCTEVVAKLNSDILHDVKCVIVGFNLKYFVDGKMVLLHSNTGKLTESMLNAVKKFSAGDVFLISGVVAKSQDGKMHILPTLEFTVASEK